MNDLKTVENLIANKFKVGNIYYDTSNHLNIVSTIYFLLIKKEGLNLSFLFFTVNKNMKTKETTYSDINLIEKDPSIPSFSPTSNYTYYINDLKRLVKVEKKEEKIIKNKAEELVNSKFNILNNKIYKLEEKKAEVLKLKQIINQLNN